MSFKEIIAVYTENHTKPKNAGLLIIKADGTKSLPLGFKGLSSSNSNTFIDLLLKYYTY
jgi:hypothetical protein